MTAVVVRTSPSRALTVTEPVYRPLSLFNEMERIASELWESPTPVSYRTGLYPPVDMFEHKDELVMRVELPGIRKEDIGVHLEGDILNITADKKPEEVSKDATYYASERCFGDYSRSVSLPFPVNTDKVTATFENGLLDIRLPKAEEAKGKKIEVKVK